MHSNLKSGMCGGSSLLPNWRATLFTGILLNFFFSQGNSMYFTQPEVNISRTFLPDTGFLYMVKAIPSREEDGQIQYSISRLEERKGLGEAGGNRNLTKGGKCLELVIDRNLGNISAVLPSDEKGERITNISSLAEPGKHCKYRVLAKLKRNESFSKADTEVKAEMRLNFKVPAQLSILSSTSDCKTVSKKELCFGGLDELNLRVMENAPVTQISFLGALPGMCGRYSISYNVTYNVSIAEGLISTEKVSNAQPLPDVLVTKADLDREYIEKYNISLNCILESSEEPNKIELVQIEGKLRILDENDNVPFPESDNSTNHVMIRIYLSDHNYDMRPRIFSTDHSELLARDPDTVDVNNLRVYSINDTKQLLEFNLKLFAAVTDGVINATSVIILTSFSENVKNIPPWDGFYCVLAVLKDVSVLPPKQGLTLNYTVCINWGQKSALPRPSERPSTEDLLERLSHQVTEAQLPRSVQKYAPVLYPFPDIVQDVSESVPGLEFTLTHVFGSYEDELDSNDNTEGGLMMTSSEYMEVFEVTPRMGIIYVVNPEPLSHSPFRSLHLQLYCNSTLIPSFQVNVTIFLEDPLRNETVCDDELCALHSDSKSCELSCGYGSMGKCLWRHETGFNNSLSVDDPIDQYTNAPYFPTCSPRLSSCPDRKCDEMEQMFPHLCPQDCATEYRGFVRLLEHSDGRFYGIDGKFCKGVATCQDPHTCSCGDLPPPMVESSLSPEARPSPNVENLASSATVMYMAISLIAVAFIMLTVYIWKTRNDRKRKSRSLNQSVMMTANGIEIPYGEHMGHGTLMSDAEYIARGLNHTTILVSDDQFGPNHVIQVETKWEISREDLFLEHVLGEGQFGRVLKGRLHGHGAHIPVAVKILKVDAAEGTKSLWQEFMAEFSLLKQVDHPNVIKLLGACTVAGGPPYLVMEYAEYGALRSFLRKCRRVEKISSSNGALHWDNPDLSGSPCSEPLDLDYVVTPREVLGFSWQIAKGMAYLSDMKMVHRDLAARNILLTKLKVCKISDFGLTRDIYVDDAYQKKSKDRVPVKWLAPECLADELYTTKSDVWAFGILVWELTTLGASPYPGIQTEQLYSLLNTGYRMPQPHNCSNELYSLMWRCWAYQPTNRPTFHQIVLELSKMLEDGIEYLKLDVPSVSNPGYDYFSQADRTGSEVVNLSPATDFPMPEARQMSRRKLSMENLRLIDYEISTDDEFLSKRRSDSRACTNTRHTYINDPNPTEQDCSKVKPSVASSSSGYESPIRHPASVAV